MATLQGTKWHLEGVTGNKAVVIESGNSKQSVLIYKVKDSVVTIKGKVASISIDNSQGVGIIFDSVIATAEVVNSSKIQLQANGSIPNITLDKSQGVTIYIQTAEGKSVEIVTSGSSEVNVVTPGKTENDDPVEQPIPAQFITKFGADGKLVTKAVEHVGV